MKAKNTKKNLPVESSMTLRRSFALPRQLVETARELSDPALRDNLNRLVTTALVEYVARRERARFGEAMTRMAADPEIRHELARIQGEFSRAELDGLEDDEW